MHVAIRSVLLAVVMAPTPALADAIAPFDGECPPGLVEGIEGHAEACIPRSCVRDEECGGGAVCRDVPECWAPREWWGGRVRLETPEMRDTVIGACRADGTCEEGRCVTRRQCEPSGSTPAWDPAVRRWTGQPHPRSACSVGHGGPRPGALALLGLALALARLRRRR
jgi:MYXO-CTERM domain-containing protein